MNHLLTSPIILLATATVVAAGSIQYSYDPSGRLTNAHYSQSDQSYAYDSLGNILTASSSGPAATYTINATAGSHGSIYPARAEVQQLGAVTFNIIPEFTNVVQSVWVNGKPVGAVDYYNFREVTSNQVITAEFAAMQLPTAPQNITPSSNLLNQIRICWDPPAGAVNGYAVYRSTRNDIQTATIIAMTEDTCLEDRQVRGKQKYYYWIRPYNDVGYGEPSAPVEAAARRSHISAIISALLDDAEEEPYP